MPNDATTPILISAGQFTDQSNSEDGHTPVQMIAQAIEEAKKSLNCAQLFNHVDVVACSGLTVDEKQVKTPFSGMVKNVPLAAATAAGLKAKRYVYAQTGGNTPQMLVNHFAKSIAKGECETIVLAGGEALHTMNLRFNHWSKFLRPKRHWKDQAGLAPEMIGEARNGSSDYENAYAMNLPANVYPMFENALRARAGRSIKDHQKYICELFARISKVAGSNPFAWFEKPPQQEDLLEQSQRNRMVAFPYRKRLNSMILVNQSAAVVMTSVARAKALGIPSEKWVYLHGYADGCDIWNVSQRINYHSSPAMVDLFARALSMANKSIDDIATFDIYSCFPSAVQIACDAMGMSHNDSRSISLTGGLPYFGGPGNNYSMHAIAEMLSWARNNPNEIGMLNANGWYLTKHSVGVYSQTPPEHDFRVDTQVNQAVEHAPQLNRDAQGDALIETYTVLHNRQDKPNKSIIVARTPEGQRCLATTDNKLDTLTRLMEEEGVGLKGELVKRGNRTLFEF